MIKGKDYYDRLRHLNLSTLKERRTRRDLEISKMYKGFARMDISEANYLQRIQMLKILGAKLEKPGCIRTVGSSEIFWIKKWWIHLVSVP